MINGMLNVYKEKGYTSHDVVAKLRGITGQRKIGHTGTLDPEATGVLPVCLGKATKLCGMLADRDKTYETVLLLGCTTDTQDVSGEVQKSSDISGIIEDQVRNVIESFVGEYAQIPPMYSALKVNGKKLYELAREGKEIERKTRRVKIHRLQILKMDLPRVTMEVSCSKGTYIRTLCHDIGEKLGCGGCMEELTRTKVGSFGLRDSLTLDAIRKKQEAGILADMVIPIDTVFQQYKKVIVNSRWQRLAYNGNSLPQKAVAGERMQEQECVRLYDGKGHFIGIYKWEEKKQEYHLIKMFFQEED